MIEARTGVRIGRAQLAGLAGDLAAWTGDFYDQRARDAGTGLPASEVLMMQADGKGIALRPGHRGSAGKTDAAHPGIKKMAEIVAVADFTAVREPQDIAAPPARRRAHPGPAARDKWVSASITSDMWISSSQIRVVAASRQTPQTASSTSVTFERRVSGRPGNRANSTAITRGVAAGGAVM